MNKPIYVETNIHSDMDTLWEATQNPKQHEKWDLRFTSINYLPKEEGKPQYFSYQTNIGFGLKIKGWGKSSGNRNTDDGTRTSSLHFGTDDKWFIIKEGRGYWQYKPKGNGVTFLTQYNYDVNFGRAGKWFDKLLFRPLIGWATALSFDVLKRWLEKGDAPATQYLRFFTSTIIAWLFAFVWIYHGLIPKLIFLHPEEVIPIIHLLPVSFGGAERLVILLGVAEIAFGLLWLFYKKRRILYLLQWFIFLLMTLFIAIANPRAFIQPFNPLTFNMSLLVLSVIGWMLSKDIPSASGCKRRR